MKFRVECLMLRSAKRFFVPAIPLSSVIFVRDFRSEGDPFPSGLSPRTPDLGEQLSLWGCESGCEIFWREAEEK